MIRFLTLLLLGTGIGVAASHAAGWEDVAVRVTNRRGPITDLGSGTLVAGDGTTALVITCRHLFREGRGALSVERPDHRRYPARLIGTSRVNDIAALEIPDPGVKPLRIAEQQPPAATMIGWGDSRRPWKHRGQLVEHDRDTVFYSFLPQEGDSGGGAFDDTGALAGVVWGTTGKVGAVVPLADLRYALSGPACSRYFQTSNTKEASPMIPSLILAGAMLGQSPPMPGKSAPLSVQPSQQAQTYAPQSLAPQVYDVPITVRVRIQPEIDVQSYAPRPQIQQQPISYGGGGCYGGSYSASSYGVSRARVIEVPETPATSIICSGGRCFPVGETFGLSSGGVVRNHVKIKNKSQSGRSGGMLGLNWFARQ